MASPNKEPMEKHFQNDQRRHNENEAESHLKRGCVRTEQTDSSLPPSDVFSRQQTTTARSPVDSSAQFTGRFPSHFDALAPTNGRRGMNEEPHQTLPHPADIDRHDLIAFQHYPEHLRLQRIFNQWPHQRQHTTDGIYSEARQYNIEQKKRQARLILTRISDELRFQSGQIMDEKLIDRIIESLERLWH